MPDYNITMGPTFLDGVSDGYSAVKEKVADNYHNHPGTYKAVGTVAAGVGAYLLAKEGMDAMGFQEYLANSMPWLGHYADAVANGTAGVLAALGAKAPVEKTIKYLDGQRKHEKGTYAADASESGAKEVAEEIIEGMDGTDLGCAALGMPVGLTDMKELYDGVKSDYQKNHGKGVSYKEKDPIFDENILGANPAPYHVFTKEKSGKSAP